MIMTSSCVPNLFVDSKQDNELSGRSLTTDYQPLITGYGERAPYPRSRRFSRNELVSEIANSPTTAIPRITTITFPALPTPS